MRGKKLYIAICISAMIHLALIVMATYVAYREPAEVLGSKVAGDDIVITVLSQDIRSESPSGDMETKAVMRRESTRMIAPSPARPSQTPHTDVTMRDVGTSKGGHSADKRGTAPGRKHGEKQLARIWRKINRAKYYPLHARRNLWEGNPRVTFKIGNEGHVEYVRLVKSCGITELDDAAIETVRRAVPLPHYPKAITLTIRYSLRE